MLPTGLLVLFIGKENPQQIHRVLDTSPLGSAGSPTHRSCQGFACQAEKEENPGSHLSANPE